MLPESLVALPDFISQPVLGFLADNIFHPPSSTPETASPYMTLILRWIHVLAGIIWIGHLYFFNLVNVNLMKALDGPTKGKVIPQLMPRALWWFRWGAVLTVLVGLMYYAMYVLAARCAERASKRRERQHVDHTVSLAVDHHSDFRHRNVCDEEHQ